MTVQRHTAVGSALAALSETLGQTIPQSIALKALEHFEAMCSKDYEFHCWICGYEPVVLIQDVQKKACFQLNGNYELRHK